MNRVILMGRLVADPETRFTPNNISVTRFSLAVNRQGKPQEGQPTADFFDIVAWRQTSDFVGKYFKKGMQVAIEGYLRNNNWTDKEGQKRFRTEIHVDQAYFADSRRDGQGGNDSAPSGSGYQRGYGNGGSAGSPGGNPGGGSSHQGGNSGSQGGHAAASSSNAPVPETGDGFYTLNEDDEDLPF
jgi:single-strand DNA-binding protein